MKNWQIKTLKQLYVPINNLSYSRDFLTETPQQVAYIHYGDIHTDKIPEVVSAKTTMSFLLDSIFIPSEEKYLLKEGDIVLVDASEDYEGVGKNIEISAIQNKKIVSGLHTIALRPIDATNLTPGFGRYLLKHPLVSKRLKAIAQGTKVFSISFTLIQKLKVPFPPLEEQRKIVEVLETWDKAITLTKQLIEQKELQKKYLMQQLLTGRTRLKGFTDMWQNVRLKQICSIKKGQQLNTNTLTKKGQYACLNGGIIPSGYTTKWNTEAKTISISEGGNSCGYVNWNDARFWAGGHCYTLANVKMHDSFLYFLLKNQERHIMNLRVGSGLPNIQLSSLENLLLKIPGRQKEQQAIAEVFSSANKEIYLLKQKLAKLEEQKKGLMQVLLTGKVRLVK